MKKTAAALALVIGALAIPLIAWWFVGMQGVRQQMARVEKQPAAEAAAAAEKLAWRLAARLQMVVDAETQRPFYHYQNLYHDPRGASEGVSVLPSPLAAGPGNPLIRAHFQIDAQGRLTLPSLNDEIPALNEPGIVKKYQPVLESLHPAAKPIAALLPPWSEAKAASRRPPPDRVSVSGSDEPAADPPELFLKERISRRDWEQNLYANRFYRDLLKPVSGEPPLKPAGSGEVEIETGHFSWHTLTLDGRSALLALRQVRTPAGVIVQGFEIDLGLAAAQLKEYSPMPLHLAAGSAAPAAGSETAVAKLAVGESDWRVELDSRDAIAAARQRAAALQRRFRQKFLAGALLALLAGLLIIRLVFRTERLAAERSRFAATAAHELRTPLAGLQVYGEMLAENLGDPARAKIYAGRMADEAARLGRVVANVLEFTRLERGALAVHPEPGDLAAAVRSCLSRLEPSLAVNHATLEIIEDGALPPVPFDRDALQQILLNLVDNAEKYSRDAADRAITVKLSAAEFAVNISVSDRGPGIPPAARNRLFRPFARGGAHDGPAGLGLGLTLVQALVKAHGGAIACEAREGGGTTFVVALPR
jgi:signal transduction histidine kinase